MTFILSCLFYSFIGCLAGFFSHVFNGLLSKDVNFNRVFINKTLRNFIRILGVMTLATFLLSIIILGIPESFFTFLGSDIIFFHQLLYYLLAFAAFDFGLKN